MMLSWRFCFGLCFFVGGIGSRNRVGRKERILTEGVLGCFCFIFLFVVGLGNWKCCFRDLRLEIVDMWRGECSYSVSCFF